MTKIGRSLTNEPSCCASTQEVGQLPHLEPHSDSGKDFFVNLVDREPQSVYDKNLHGSLIRLIDWADRFEKHSDFTTRQIEQALMFYAHRHLPDLAPTDGVQLGSIDLDGLVFGTRVIAHDGQTFQDLVVLQKAELELADTNGV